MATKKKKTTKKTAKKAVKTSAKKNTRKVVKSTTKKAIKSTKTTSKKPETKKEFVLKRNGTDKEGNAQFSAIKVYARKPNGWKESRTASGVPKGLKLIHNGKSTQSGERRTGFIKKK